MKGITIAANLLSYTFHQILLKLVNIWLSYYLWKPKRWTFLETLLWSTTPCKIWKFSCVRLQRIFNLKVVQNRSLLTTNIYTKGV